MSKEKGETSIFNNSHHNYITQSKELDVLYMIKKRRMAIWKSSKQRTKSTE